MAKAELDVRAKAMELQQEYNEATAKVKDLTDQINLARKQMNRAQKAWLDVAAQMLHVGEVKVAASK